MKENQEEIRRLINETYSRYNMTIAYFANCLKAFGKNGVLPVIWDDENYVADAVYDD